MAVGTRSRASRTASSGSPRIAQVRTVASIARCTASYQPPPVVLVAPFSKA